MVKRYLLVLAVIAISAAVFAKSVGELAGEATQLSNEGKYAQAAEKFNEAIQLAPANGSLYFNLGLVYKLMGRYDDAVRMIDRAVSLGQQTPQVYETLGFIYEAQAVAAPAAKAREFWLKAQKAWENLEVCATDEERKKLSRKHIDRIKEILQ
ncbi:MAG: tetratricopeptide repeat protein [Elusimicrobiaceae bacterium]|jgi:Flp pilus assembly protein TadD